MDQNKFLFHALSGKKVDRRSKPGLQVKTGLQAGGWRCTSCEGQANGSNLIKPRCNYCELT